MALAVAMGQPSKATAEPIPLDPTPRFVSVLPSAATTQFATMLRVMPTFQVPTPTIAFSTPGAQVALVVDSSLQTHLERIADIATSASGATDPNLAHEFQTLEAELEDRMLTPKGRDLILLLGHEIPDDLVAAGIPPDVATMYEGILDLVHQAEEEKAFESRHQPSTPTKGAMRLQIRLAYLGYYTQAPFDGIAGVKTCDAVDEFLENNNSETGLPYWVRIKHAYKKKLLSDLQRLGYGDSGSPVQEFQVHHRIKHPVSFEFHQILENELLSLEDVADRTFRDRSTSPNPLVEVRRQPGLWSKPSLAAVPGNRVEAWRVTDGVISERHVDDKAIELLQADYRRRVREYSRTNRAKNINAKFVHVSHTRMGSEAHIQLGDRSIRVSERALELFLMSDEEVPELDGFFRDATAHDGSIVFWRDPLVRGFDLEHEKKIIDGVFGVHYRHYGIQLLAQAVRRRLGPDARIYTDDDMGRALANIELATNVQVGGAKDLAFYSPPLESGIQHAKKIRDHLSNLDPGIEHVTDLRTVEASNVVVVSGNHETSLRSYLRELGSRGALRGKYLLLLSCGVSDSPSFSTELLVNYGVVAVRAFPTELHPDAALAIVDELVTQAKSVDSREVTLEVLLGRAVDAAVSHDEEKGAGFLVDKIKELRLGVPQVSLVQPPKFRREDGFDREREKRG